MTIPAVDVKDLWKWHPNRQPATLKGVSFSVPPRSISGIIGRSGAGKSTLMRCLNGLEPADKGRIFIQSEELTGASLESRRKILKKVGTVFQTFNLLSHQTVWENIALPLKWLGVSAAQRKEKAACLAQEVGLDSHLLSYPSQLSGGQCQRVAIARGLVTDAPILLCDEFTSALDPETTLEILALLRHLNQRLGVTIVLITHDMEVVREVCDDVCVLDEGCIVERGGVGDILLKPQHVMTQSLVRGLFSKALPHSVMEVLEPEPREGDHALLRLVFEGESARSPVLADLIRRHGIDVNILAGSLDHIREHAFGTLIVSFLHQKNHLDLAKAHFAQHNIATEVVGYIPL